MPFAGYTPSALRRLQQQGYGVFGSGGRTYQQPPPTGLEGGGEGYRSVGQTSGKTTPGLPDYGLTQAEMDSIRAGFSGDLRRLQQQAMSQRDIAAGHGAEQGLIRSTPTQGSQARIDRDLKEQMAQQLGQMNMNMLSAQADLARKRQELAFQARESALNRAQSQWQSGGGRGGGGGGGGEPLTNYSVDTKTGKRTKRGRGVTTGVLDFNVPKEYRARPYAGPTGGGTSVGGVSTWDRYKSGEFDRSRPGGAL